VGSRAYAALTDFHLAGGRGDFGAWAAACQRSGPIREFQKIMDILQFLGLVAVDGGIYSITQRGLAHIHVEVDELAAESAVPAAQRTFVSDRPLARKNMVRMPLTREGAHDYASIPSRMGNQSVPHLAAGTLIGGDKR
jgi:hypothetical protein